MADDEAAARRGPAAVSLPQAWRQRWSIAAAGTATMEHCCRCRCGRRGWRGPGSGAGGADGAGGTAAACPGHWPGLGLGLRRGLGLGLGRGLGLRCGLGRGRGGTGGAGAGDGAPDLLGYLTGVLVGLGRSRRGVPGNRLRSGKSPAGDEHGAATCPFMDRVPRSGDPSRARPPGVQRCRSSRRSHAGTRQNGQGYAPELPLHVGGRLITLSYLRA